MFRCHYYFPLAEEYAQQLSNLIKTKSQASLRYEMKKMKNINL